MGDLTVFSVLHVPTPDWTAVLGGLHPGQQRAVPADAGLLSRQDVLDLVAAAARGAGPAGLADFLVQALVPAGDHPDRTRWPVLPDPSAVERLLRPAGPGSVAVLVAPAPRAVRGLVAYVLPGGLEWFPVPATERVAASAPPSDLTGYQVLAVAADGAVLATPVPTRSAPPATEGGTVVGAATVSPTTLRLPARAADRGLEVLRTRSVVDEWLSLAGWPTSSSPADQAAGWEESLRFLDHPDHRKLLLEKGRPLLRSLAPARNRPGRSRERGPGAGPRSYDDLLADGVEVHLALLDLAHRGDERIGFDYLTTGDSLQRRRIMSDNLPHLGARLAPVAELHRGMARPSQAEEAYATVLTTVLQVMTDQTAGVSSDDLEKQVTGNQPMLGPTGRIDWVMALNAWGKRRPPTAADRNALRKVMRWVVTCP